MAGNLAPIIPALFTGPNGERLTADQIKRRQEIAQSLMAQATDTSPNAGGWASVLAKGVQGFAAGRQNRHADNAASLNSSESSSRIAALLGGLSGSPVGQMGTAATPTVAPIQNVAPANTVASLGGNDIVADVLAAAPNSQGGQNLAEYIRYANQGATRSLPLSEKLTSALGFLPELGVTAEVFSGGQPAKGSGGARVGSVRHDHGDAADVFFYKDGRKLDWSRPEDQPIFQEIVKRGRSSGLTGFGAGPGYMQQGSMHVGFGSPGVWGAGGSGNNAPEWLRAAFGQTAPASRPMPSYEQAMSTAQPVQVAQSTPTVNPAVVEALSSPYASSEEKQIASLLLERQMGEQQQQQKLALAQQQRQQEIARRQAIAQQNGINPAFASDDELWKGAAGQLFAAPSTSTVGSSVIDNRTGKPIYQGTPEATTTQRDYEYYANRETQAGRTPLGPLEYEQALRRSGANNQNISVGGEKFDEQFGSLDAKALSETATAGMAAQRNVGRIDQLEKVLSEVPSGAEANFKQIAGNYGINLGADTSNIQAAQALINSLVPEQRQPGSGPMSDADLELFKQSLPRIINQPGGNQQIINTMRGVAQYDAEGARIVQRLRLPDGDPQKLTRAQAFEALQSRPNPLANFKAPEAVTTSQPTQADGWRDAGNGIRIRPKGGN